MAETFKWIFFT